MYNLEAALMKKTAFLLSFLLLVSALWAQQKYALVIGNSNYTGISRLANPVNDANDMAAALQSLGFTVDKVIDGNLDQMETAINNLKRKLGASRNSYGFFFYAGHGVQANGQNYLIPLPATNIQNETHLRTRAVSLEFVLDSLSEAENELNMVVLDACRDNPFGWSRSGNRGLSVVTRAPSGSIVMYAAASGQKADDGSGRNGLFTSHLLRNLKTAGLSVYEIFDRTMGDVKNVTGGKQDPELSLRFSGANSVFLGQRPTPNTPVQPNPEPIIEYRYIPSQPAPTVHPTDTGSFIQQGNATWYKDESYELEAKHARFPPGTRLRVTNLNNQREVYVTVTDRIPNSDNRILDLSQAAAELLGMNRSGSTSIRLVVIRGLVAE
jgi:hypothetical protein